MRRSRQPRRSRIDYPSRTEAELQKALDYPVNEPNKSAYKNKYRAALRRATRNGRWAVHYGQWTEEQQAEFERRIDAVWK